MIAGRQVADISKSAQDVRDRLAAGKSARPVRAHMAHMWEQVLESERSKEQAMSVWHDRWGELQLPYVPVHPERYGLTLTADSAMLDVGSFSGYGLYDFCRRRLDARLPIPRITGIDIEAAECEAGRELAALWARDVPALRFLQADCEKLPMPSGSFDLVIARSVLPYTDVGRSLRELRRVVRTSGLVVVQLHSPIYYGAQALRARSFRRLSYYVRPILSGALLASTGHQPPGRRFRETAVTLASLQAQCKRVGLTHLWSIRSRYRPLALFRAVE